MRKNVIDWMPSQALVVTRPQETMFERFRGEGRERGLQSRR
jgi:hypothetical protein